MLKVSEKVYEPTPFRSRLVDDAGLFEGDLPANFIVELKYSRFRQLEWEA
jgi:hypothetical protein